MKFQTVDCLNLESILINLIGKSVWVLNVFTFDIIENKNSDLKYLIELADCISIHIPKNDKNICFFSEEKLSWMNRYLMM